MKQIQDKLLHTVQMSTERGEGKIDMEKPILVARDQQLNELIQGLESLIQGNFSLSLVTGPAGVGKTYLVEQVEKLFLENNLT